MTAFLWLLTGSVGTFTFIVLAEMVSLWICLPMAVTKGWSISNVMPKWWVRFCLRHQMDRVYVRTRSAVEQQPYYVPLHVILFDDHIRRHLLHGGMPKEQLQDIVERGLQDCTVGAAIDLYARLRGTGRGDVWENSHWRTLVYRHKALLMKEDGLWIECLPHLLSMQREAPESWSELADAARRSGRFFRLCDLYGSADLIPPTEATDAAMCIASKEASEGDPLERLAALVLMKKWDEIWRLAAVWQEPEIRQQYLDTLHSHGAIGLKPAHAQVEA